MKKRDGWSIGDRFVYCVDQNDGIPDHWLGSEGKVVDFPGPREHRLHGWAFVGKFDDDEDKENWFFHKDCVRLVALADGNSDFWK